MFGILSNKSNIKTYSNNLFSLFRSSLNNKFHTIIVFTIFDIDFSNKTVSGNLITKDNIEICKMPIPTVIYNFSYQQNNSDKKKIRILAEQDNVTLMNETNRFNQDMIMEMLSSCSQFNPMLLGQLDLLQKERKEDSLVIPNTSSQVNLNNEAGILILPKNRFYSSKVTWLKKDFEHDCCINQLVFNSELSVKNWFVFGTSDLLLYKNHPVIITLYIQRGIHGKWTSLPGTKLPKKMDENNTLIEKLNSAAIDISGYIGNFIPNIAFCGVTFVLDKNFNPFFINLGGWNPTLLRAKNNHDLQSDFINNLFGYYELKKGGIDYVD